TDYGEKIGAGLDQRPAILLSDAADRATWHDGRLRPIGQQLGAGAVFGTGLCHARKERSERDVVGAGFRGDNGAVPAVATGDSDNAVGTQKAARIVVGHVLLADMHAVAIELGRKVRPVVHDE